MSRRNKSRKKSESRAGGRKRKSASNLNRMPKFANKSSGRSSRQLKFSRRKQLLHRTVTALLLAGLAGWLLLFGWTMEVKSDKPSLAEQGRQRLEQTSRLRWLADSTDLEQYLLRQNPQYSQIKLHQPLFSRTLNIKGYLSQPKLQWRSGGRTLALSEDGVAIRSVEQPLEDLPLINDQTNLNYQPGDRVASAQLVSFLLELNNLDKKQFNFKAISLSNSRVVTLQLDQQFRVILATDIDPNAQLTSAKRLVEQGSQPTRYIDTSIPGRIFWQ